MSKPLDPPLGAKLVRRYLDARGYDTRDIGRAVRMGDGRKVNLRDMTRSDLSEYLLSQQRQGEWRRFLGLTESHAAQQQQTFRRLYNNNQIFGYETGAPYYRFKDTRADKTRGARPFKDSDFSKAEMQRNWLTLNAVPIPMVRTTRAPITRPDFPEAFLDVDAPLRHPDGGHWVPVHPIAAERSPAKVKRSERKRSFYPTASIRSFALQPEVGGENPNLQVSVNLPGYHDTTRREIGRRDGETSVDATHLMLTAIQADKTLKKFTAIYPEPMALTRGDSTVLLRMTTPYPPLSKPTRGEYLLEHGRDIRGALYGPTELERIIAARPPEIEDPWDYVWDILMKPYLKTFMGMLVDHGLVYMGAHSQNVLLEVDHDRRPTGRIIVSDLDKIHISPLIRSALGLEDDSLSFSYPTSELGSTVQEQFEELGAFVHSKAAFPSRITAFLRNAGIKSEDGNAERFVSRANRLIRTYEKKLEAMAESWGVDDEKLLPFLRFGVMSDGTVFATRY